MLKLNNSRILLAILLIFIFGIFLTLIICLCSSTYFLNLEYVGFQDNPEYKEKYRITIMFNEYGQVQRTTQLSYDGKYAKEKSVSYGTYEFHNDKEPSFEIDRWLNALHYRNAFQLEKDDIIFTNTKAITMLVFFCVFCVSSLAIAVFLLGSHKKGHPVFGNTKRLQAQIDELQKQIEELNDKDK